MASTRGPRPQAIRLLMLNILSCCTAQKCGADAMRVQKYRHGMEVVQRRGALRIASSCQILFGPAVLVIANVVLIDLLAFERKGTYDQMREIGKQRAIAEARESTPSPPGNNGGRKKRKDG